MALACFSCSLTCCFALPDGLSGREESEVVRVTHIHLSSPHVLGTRSDTRPDLELKHQERKHEHSQKRCGSASRRRQRRVHRVRARRRGIRQTARAHGIATLAPMRRSLHACTSRLPRHGRCMSRVHEQQRMALRCCSSQRKRTTCGLQRLVQRRHAHTEGMRHIRRSCHANSQLHSNSHINSTSSTQRKQDQQPSRTAQEQL